MAELLTVNQQGLETDLTGWSDRESCTVARSTAQAFAGVASLEITSTAAVSQAIASTTPNNIAVTANGLYTLGGAARAGNVAREIWFVATWYTSGLAEIGGSAIFVNSVTTEWRSISGQVQAPSNAAFAEFQVYVRYPQVGDVHYVDAMSLSDYLALNRRRGLLL